MDLISKAVNYVKDTAEWVASGKPYRSDSDIGAIFTNICSPCEHFERESESRGVCALCGCKLRNTGKYLNKIAWGTSKCPAGKWG